MPSGGSNLSLSAKQLRDSIKTQQAKFGPDAPADLIFASASGLDPHISPQAALLQVERIAKARNFNSVQKQKLIQCVKNITEAPQYLILGDERINVFLLNLETDKIR